MCAASGRLIDAVLVLAEAIGVDQDDVPCAKAK
jgi:hypothetical protein